MTQRSIRRFAVRRTAPPDRRFHQCGRPHPYLFRELQRSVRIMVVVLLGTFGLVGVETLFAPPSAQAQNVWCTKKQVARLKERLALRTRDQKKSLEQETLLYNSLDTFDGLRVASGGPIVLSRSWLLTPPVSRDVVIVFDQLAAIVKRDVPNIERVTIVEKTGQVTSPLPIFTLFDATVFTSAIKKNAGSPERLSVALAELSSRSARARAAIDREIRDLQIATAQQSNDVYSLRGQLRDCGVPCAVTVQQTLLTAVFSTHNAPRVARFAEVCATPATDPVPSTVVATTPSTVVPVSSTVVPTGLVLESVRPAAGVLWTISGDGKTATFTGPFGTQMSEFPAPEVVPAAGVTFTWTLTATASVSNLATECEVKGSGFVATATPGLHAAAFSPAPGQTNVMKVSITLKPASLSPGATAQLFVGCFSNYGFFFDYKAK